MQLRFLSMGVLVVAAIACLGIVVHAADLSYPLLWLLTAAFGAWVVSPYCFMFLASRKEKPNAIYDGVILATSIGLAVFGFSIYYDGFFVHLDAQNSLLFLFIPLWQWVGAAAIVWLLGLWQKRNRSA